MNTVKKSLAFTFIAAIAAASFAADKRVLFAGFADASNFGEINLKIGAVSKDAKSFAADTSKSASEKNLLFRTSKKALKPGSTYTARITYTLENPDSAKLVSALLKGVADDKPACQYHMGASRETSFAKLVFNVPESAKKAYFKLEANGKFKIDVKSFSITEGDGENFIPAKPDAKPFAGGLKNLPTGATEFEVELPRQTNGIVINAADFGMNAENENCAEALNAAIEAARQKKASRLVVPKGVYKFYSDTPVALREFSDFTFDGGGSTFVFRRKEGRANMIVSFCERVELANFNMDYDWQTEPLAAIAKMTGIGREGEKFYFDFELVDYKAAGKNYAHANTQVRVADVEGWDNDARSVGAENAPSFGFGFSPKDAHKSPELKWFSGVNFRMYVSKKHYDKAAEKSSVGKHFRIQHYYYGLGGFYLESNKNFSMRDINVFSCKGHAILIMGKQQNYQLLNVDIMPPKNDPFRVVSCTADHMHIGFSRGNLKMIGCDFGLGADDCLNIHDNTTFCVKSGEREITIKTRNAFKVGDVVEFLESNYAPANFKAKVVGVDYKDKNNRRVTLDKPVPAPIYDGFVVYNRDFDSSNLIMRDCSFAKNRARGLLLLTKNITIENCRFYHTQMGAIKFETGFTMNVWCEGYGARNAIVRNCVFDCANAIDRKYQNKARDIFMGVYLRRDPSLEQSSYPVIRDILFEGNTFNDSYGVVALISSAQNITFRNNTFKSSTPRQIKNYYRSAFYVNCARDINIVNNTWIESPLAPNVGVFYDNDTVKNLTFEGNTIKK